jgi:hypothetical protein
MANPEHLAILKQGVKAWNKWREMSGVCDRNFLIDDLNNLDNN